MSWIKTAGGSWTNTKDGTTIIKTPGGTLVNTKTGGSMIKTAGGSWIGSAGYDETSMPSFILDEE